jgi:hypothetical protein
LLKAESTNPWCGRQQTNDVAASRHHELAEGSQRWPVNTYAHSLRHAQTDNAQGAMRMLPPTSVRNLNWFV